jgi:glycosyltransferase involved in cell wall biosynthesis
MGRLPKVSIITSTYNRSAALRRAIESVRAQQGFDEWEMCIVGDCTPDDSAAVVASFGDERLRFYNLPVKSPPRAHGAIAKNYGIFQMARAPYIAYLDDDDEYGPDFLRVMTSAATKHPECPLTYCRARYVDQDTGHRIRGNPFQGWILRWNRDNLQRFNFLVSNGVLHARAILDEVGGWNPDDYFDDYDLWKRMARQHDFHYVNRVLCVVHTKADPFLKRLLTKGLKILRHGRRLEDQG